MDTGKLVAPPPIISQDLYRHALQQMATLDEPFPSPERQGLGDESRYPAPDAPHLGGAGAERRPHQGFSKTHAPPPTTPSMLWRGNTVDGGCWGESSGEAGEGRFGGATEDAGESAESLAQAVVEAAAAGAAPTAPVPQWQQAGVDTAWVAGAAGQAGVQQHEFHQPVEGMGAGSEIISTCVSF